MKVSNAIGEFYHPARFGVRLGQNRPVNRPPLPRRHALTASLALLALGPTRAAATTVWRVGPGQALTRIADALARAGDGDTIEVLPGTYRGDVAVIRQRRLRIVGIGGQPVLQADGQHAEGKAIWVVRDGDIEVENLAFQGARVPDGNGAGIRFERGRLRLRHCAFRDNQNGILTGADPAGVLDIDHCLFENAPDNPGSLPHLLYVGGLGLLRLHGCVLRRGRVGHLLKSRAREVVVTGNHFDDGLDGQASYEIDLPNGGIALIEGNTLVQSPLTQNPVMVAYGAEGHAWPESRLTLRGNTFVNHRPAGGWFVRVWPDRLPPGTVVHSSGNRLLGPGSLALGPQGQSVDDLRGPVPAAAPAAARRASGD